MRTSVLLCCLLVSACGSVPASQSKGPQGYHPIDQFSDGGVALPDGGTPNSDLRVAVAYCAAAILDTAPNSCEVVSADTEIGLETECDNGLTIRWNCATCGDALLDNQTIGHVQISPTDSTTFQVKSTKAQAPLYYCHLNDKGNGFTVEQAK
jgi:hypothetical protein